MHRGWYRVSNIDSRSVVCSRVDRQRSIWYIVWRQLLNSKAQTSISIRFGPRAHGLPYARPAWHPSLFFCRLPPARLSFSPQYPFDYEYSRLPAPVSRTVLNLAALPARCQHALGPPRPVFAAGVLESRAVYLQVRPPLSLRRQHQHQPLCLIWA